MKDRVERFVVLPFSIGCSSDSSIALGTSNNGGINSKPIKKSKSQPNPRPTTSMFLFLSFNSLRMFLCAFFSWYLIRL